jgi:hypothetical protein
MTRIRVADLRSDCPSGRGVDVDGVETEPWEVKTINKGGIELAVRQGFVPGRGEPREPRRCLKPWRADN